MFFFKNSANSNDQKSLYDLEIESISGEIIKLKDYRDKVILIVNTASYCGFTKQYQDLQDLWDEYKSKGLIVLGVPSDSFNQEKKTNSEVKGRDAHEIFVWAQNNFGKSAIPKWNFHKILINKQGNVEETYASFTKPTSNKIINKIEEIL